MIKVYINPTVDPRRAEYWGNMTIKVPAVKLLKVLFDWAQDWDQEDDCYADYIRLSSAIILHSVQEGEDKVVNIQLTNHIEGTHQGDIKEAYFIFNVLTSSGLITAYTSTEVYSLYKEDRAMAQPEPWNDYSYLWPEIAEYIETWVINNSMEYEEDEMEYSLSVDGIQEVKVKEGRKGGLRPTPNQFKKETTWMTPMASPEDYESSREDLILRIDIDGNFIASTENPGWGKLSIIQATTRALINMQDQMK